jgi:hypothetical protein
MKKIIYPIAAIFALVTAASFSSDDCRDKCAGKEALKSRDHQTRVLYDHDTMPDKGVVKSQIQSNVAIAGTEPLADLLSGLKTFDPLILESDIQIDIQFNREETIIEVPDVLKADEAVTYQYNAENGTVLAFQAKQAAY